MTFNMIFRLRLRYIEKVFGLLFFATSTVLRRTKRFLLSTGDYATSPQTRRDGWSAVLPTHERC